MDTIISSAIELICSQGQAGLSPSSLWSKLNLSLSKPSLKNAIWNNLLTIPSLKFRAQNFSYDPKDPSIQSFEDAEKLELKIVAKDQLLDPFVGLYDDAKIPPDQRQALDRIATAGTNGITQKELAEEFGLKGNYLFYKVKQLESRGLIVRHQALKREPCSKDESKVSSSVTTNLMFLYRHAKHLGSQQRFEISKSARVLDSFGNENESAMSEEGFDGENVKEDVLIKDYLPAMKAICDKLEEADGKVLVVSDIKRDLGYSGTRSGHKAWRNIYRRLKDAGLVEEFIAKLNEKVELCIRLLKASSLENFEPKISRSGDNVNKEHQVKFGRRLQRNNLLVELPIEHQMYDMVDAEGSKGLAVMEVCERLGIDKKRNYSRFRNMIPRFGMHLQDEDHNKTKAFRVWTPGNFNPESSSALMSKSKTSPSENETSNLKIVDLDCPDELTQTFRESCSSDFATPRKTVVGDTDSRVSQGSPTDGTTGCMLLCPADLQESLHQPTSNVPDTELGSEDTIMETDVSASESMHMALFKPLYPSVCNAQPCHSLTPDGALREKRILERLQDERFILKAELFRWLVSLEKDKCTTMDRKTLDRILEKLQRQGHCRYVKINFPAVTNCGHSRGTMVVLNPSVQGLSPNIISEIYSRHRSFEMEIRGRGSTNCMDIESVPVLNGVQRSWKRRVDAKAVGSEAMSINNGFILAKMVRVKLLHYFLWGYLTNSPSWDEALSSGNHVHDQEHPRNTSKLFSLEEAIKAIPLELFVQVAWSTQKFADVIKKYKKGQCLGDLPSEEYKLLMDTQASGKLSLLVDILRRLKLIRLVTKGHSNDGVKVGHASLTHAIEIKPYIEEPLSIIAISSLISLDFRPRIRHDFILSSRDAVDEYWQTLEYCYAAADPRAAVHAFPGSAAPEVFRYRSWASVQPMTADQRAELKRTVKDNLKEKLPYKECVKIAKKFNLTLEQVLHVYYGNHRHRINRFESLDAYGKEQQPVKEKRSSSKKRKKSSEVSSVKCPRLENDAGQSDEQKVVRLLDTVNHSMEGHDLSVVHMEEHDHFRLSQENGNLETTEEPGPNKNHEECSLVSKRTCSKMKPIRQQRFSWTEKADRQLVIQYARQRATLGANFHRIDWASAPDLPAPPHTCAKRMSSLKRDTKFRKALMKLCNMLSKRYVKCLERNQKSVLSNDENRLLTRCPSGEGLNNNFSSDMHTEYPGCGEDRWDDFDEKNINRALEDVFLFREMAKLGVSKRAAPISEEWSNMNMNAEDDNSRASALVSTTFHNEDLQRVGGRQHKDLAQRSSFHQFHQNFIKILNVGTRVGRQVHESLAISNAVELFKLVFLSTSSAPELQNLLAEILKRYSECDLFAAFSYLRDKKFMIGGSSDQPFVLSQEFLHSVSRSPFPINTGKRAAEFSNWLHERNKDLVEGEINLTEDLRCGDIFHLFSLVSSGELSISPCLPAEGVGEAEDSRSLKLRNEDNDLSCDANNAMKLKSLTEGELVSRREKGFPGIMISLHRATISTAKAVGLFKDGGTCAGEIHGNDESDYSLCENLGSVFSHSDHMKETLAVGRAFPIAGNSSGSLWEDMANYANYLVSKCSDKGRGSVFTPEVFKVVHAAIQKSGDQGLSIEEMSHVVNIPVAEMPEHIIDVLQAFGRAFKVNSYDSVRVVDTLYCSKYYLSSMAGFCQDLLKSRSDEGNLSPYGTGDASSPRKESINSGEDFHKVTILNLPEETDLRWSEVGTSNLNEGCKQGKVVLPGMIEGGSYKFSSDELGMPILPWINGDGSINRIVYDGLVRRVLGIVMQNPGIIEDDIIRQLDVLNPQSCKTLLGLLILDRHLIVREMHQTTFGGPPICLRPLLRYSIKEPKLVSRKHFFANPMSTSLL